MNQIDQLIDSKLDHVGDFTEGLQNFSRSTHTLAIVWTENARINVTIPRFLPNYFLPVGKDLSFIGAGSHSDALAAKYAKIMEEYNDQIRDILNETQDQVVSKVDECVQSIKKAL